MRLFYSGLYSKIGVTAEGSVSGFWWALKFRGHFMLNTVNFSACAIGRLDSLYTNAHYP